MLAVIQFDAVSVPLLERLLAEGRLPALGALRARGIWHELESPATDFPASTYQTLYTGLDLGDHGQYYAFQWAPKEQRVKFRTAFPTATSVWERLSAAGRRSLVLDAYEMAPPRAIDGVFVTGWQFRNVISLERSSVPEQALRALSRSFGRPPLLQEVFGRQSPTTLRRLLPILRRAPGRVADAACHLLARERFDHLWISFLSSHLGGHLYWDLAHLEEEGLDERTREEFRGALPEIYEAVDRALERVLAALPEGADVIVLSPIGMGENTTRADLLPDLLAAVLGGGSRDADVDGAGGFLWRLREAVPVRGRELAAAALGGRLTRELTTRMSVARIDWGRTRAFVLPSDHFGQIRLNVRGRERDGIVAPGDVPALVDEIRSGLTSFEDPDGSSSVSAVDSIEELVPPSPYRDLLPDLVVRWSDRPATRLDRVRSDRFGTVRRRGGGTGRSGAHNADAWALVVQGSGSAIEPRERAHVVDVAATVCARLGADSTGLRGRSLLGP